jgi:hypothetical protein
MKRCTFEVMKLCCQLEAALEHRDKVILPTCCPFFFWYIDASHCTPNNFSGPQKPPDGLFVAFLPLGKFFRCFNFFPTASIFFRLVGTFYPESRNKRDCGGKTYLRLSRGPPVLAELPKVSSKSPVRTVHAKWAEYSPP